MKVKLLICAALVLCFAACSHKTEDTIQDPDPDPVVVPGKDPRDDADALSFEADIRRDHPRLFFNADTWKEIKARTEKSGPERDYLIKLVNEVSSMTDNPVAQNTGPLDTQTYVLDDGTIMTVDDTTPDYVVEFGSEASKCALAWRLTGNAAWLEKAKKMLSVSVAAYTEATENRRPVAWYSTGRILAICAYDWIYEALSPEERRSYIVPIMEHARLIQPEAGLNIPQQSTGGANQGFYGTRSLLWYAGLAGYGDGFDDDLASSLLRSGYGKVTDMLDYRNTSSGDDGPLSVPALNYAAGEYPYAHFNFFHTFWSSTGHNVAEDYPNLALFPNWVWWMWIRESRGYLRHHGLGDIYHSVNVDTHEALYDHLSNYIYFYKDSNPDVAKLSAVLRSRVRSAKRDFSGKYPVYPFLLGTEYPVTQSDIDRVENHSLKARYFETMGHLLMRSSWTEDATYCSLTAGTTIVPDHKHYDEGSFTIYKYDHLALDTGCRGSENDLNLLYYYAQSVAHNVFLVHKPGEMLPAHWGPKSSDAADNYNYGGMTKALSDMVAFETGEHFSYAAVDLQKAYGDKVSEAVRQFVYVHPDYFIVYDRVISSSPSYGKEWLLHMQNEPVVEGNLTRFETALGGRLFCQTFLPADATIEKVGGEGHEFQVGEKNYAINPSTMQRYIRSANSFGRGPYTGAWRIEVNAPEGEAEVRFLNVLTATSTAASTPVNASYSTDDSGHDCVTLSFEGKVFTFRFNKTGDIGGTVTVDGQTRSLTQAVQPQSGVICD